MKRYPMSGAEIWIDEYHQTRLAQKDAATVDAYLRNLRQFTHMTIFGTVGAILKAHMSSRHSVMRS